MTKQISQADAHLTLLRSEVCKMHYRGEFDCVNLRRKIRKHCKTLLLGNRFSFKLKKAEYGIFCYIGEVSSQGLTEIVVNSYRHPDKNFQFYVANNREFMNKLLKHNLL